MSGIKEFLNEVRFKTYVNDIDIPFDRTDLHHSALVCQLAEAEKILQGFKASTEYSVTSFYNVKKDIEEIFLKINEKIDTLEILAEGYQYLNTNELDNDTIHSLKVFFLKDKPGYNDITKSLTIPRINKARELKPTSTKKNNLGAEELYKLQGTYRDSLAGIVPINQENTDILRAEFLDINKNLLKDVLPVNKRILNSLPEEVKYIKVYTNNVDRDQNYYTSLSILENRYENFHSIVLGEAGFEKKGDLFKLILDAKVPTESFLIFEMRVSFVNKYTGEFEESFIYFNGIASRNVLVDKNTVKGDVMDLAGKPVNVQNTLEDYVLVNEFSSKNSSIKHIGGRVFDISGIKSETFQVTLKCSMYNTVDNTKTPEIKGLFAYVTER